MPFTLLFNRTGGVCPSSPSRILLLYTASETSPNTACYALQDEVLFPTICGHRRHGIVGFLGLLTNACLGVSTELKAASRLDTIDDITILGYCRCESCM